MSVPRGLRTVFIVTIITVIVWVMADRSVLRTSSELAVQVGIQADAQYRVTVLEPANNRPLVVKFTGPGRGIDGIMDQMAQPTRIKWEYYLTQKEAEDAVAVDRYAIPVDNGFRHLTEKYRVTLAESNVPQVVVKVQKLLREEKDVALPVGFEKLLTNEYQFVPPKVTAIGTRQDLDALTAGAVAQVKLDTLKLIAGQFEEQTVDVKPGVADLPVTFEPAKVTVKRLRLSEFIVEKTIEGRIPIRIKTTPEVMKQYYVVLDRPYLTSLKVTAPQGDDLKPEDVDAVLVLLDDEKPNPNDTPTARQLVITFPGHDRVRVAVEPEAASFTLRPREPSPTIAPK